MQKTLVTVHHGAMAYISGKVITRSVTRLEAQELATETKPTVNRRSGTTVRVWKLVAERKVL